MYRATIFHYTMLLCIILYYICYAILYYTIYAILYYAILYYAILYYSLEWVQAWQGQIVLCVNQAQWTFDVEKVCIVQYSIV